jgi:hypothetical protein
MVILQQQQSSLLDALGIGIEAVTAIVGTIIAAYVYGLSRQQRTEAWIKTYQELHETFWTDLKIARVRSWLAPGAAYEEIRNVIQLRRAIDDEAEQPARLRPTDYEALEALDRFLNFLVRVFAVTPQVMHPTPIAEALYFQYWLDQFRAKGREELFWYVSRFYPVLSARLEAPAVSETKAQSAVPVNGEKAGKREPPMTRI